MVFVLDPSDGGGGVGDPVALSYAWAAGSSRFTAGTPLDTPVQTIETPGVYHLSAA